MKLVLDRPSSWPGVAFRAGELAPLPYNLEAWRDVTLGPGPRRLIAAIERQTQAGWPVTLVVTEEGSTRRLHAFYRFLVYGCVAVLEGEAHAFDAVMDDVKDALLTGRPDFSTDSPLTVGGLFAGFAPAFDERDLPEG
jgi:hypothetical protein